MTSRAPGQHPTPESLVSADLLGTATEAELSQTVAAVLTEQHRRALDAADVPALIEQAFLDGFTTRGEPVTPWIVHGLLICPGYRRDRSATSHDCEFTSVDGHWVWEHDGILTDVMRQVPGPKMHQQTVTIIQADEGLTYDVVCSAARSGGPCQMKTARSFQIRTGAAIEVSTRARAPQGHSR
jgi:hypothetical protein